MRLRLLLLLLVSLGMPAVAFAQAAPPAREPTLRVGDAIRVAVWRRDDLSGEFAIGSDGTIVHPILRRIQVAGVAFSEVEKRINTLLGEFEGQTHFVIQPLIRVPVGGEVRQPNVLLLPPGANTSYAIALAGGPTERGNLSDVSLVRLDGSVRLDLRDPAIVNQVTLQSGDQLIVGRRGDWLRDVLIPVSSVMGALAATIAAIVVLSQ